MSSYLLKVTDNKRWKLICGCIFILFSLFLYPSHTFASGGSIFATCPLRTDTGMYSKLDSDGVVRCYSGSGGLGYNVSGLKTTCGPVVCPAESLYGGLQRGNSCIKKDTKGICRPGTVASGFFDATSDPRACIVLYHNVSVPCPKPLPLYIKIADANGAPVPDATIRIFYEDVPSVDVKGKSFDISSGNGDPKGLITVADKLYSGDHFVLIAQQGNYVITPPQYGDTNVLMKMQMNTPYSCGQRKSDPCTFLVASRADTGIAGGDAASTVLVLTVIVLIVLMAKLIIR